MFDERQIQGLLVDIRNAIVFYSDQLDYTTYINEAKIIIDKLKGMQKASGDRLERARLQVLECKALMYLNTMNKLQASYENQR